MDLKVHCYCRQFLPKVSKQTLKIMKIITVILFAACLQVSARGYSQITLSETNAPLQKVFQEIQQQSDYEFVATYETLKVGGNVTINVRDVTLQKALEECLKGKPLTYVIIGNTVVVRPEGKADYNARTAISPTPLAPPPVEIHGRVVNQKGEPLQNVSLLISGTKMGTTTNIDGRFTLTAPNDKDVVLEISSVGYVTKRVIVGKQTEINVTLELEVTGLSDIVIVGYGTQKASNVSGAIATIKSADIEKSQPVRVEDAIQGRASGVTIISSASPGVKPTLFIRGIPSFGGSDPLVVVDGTIQTLDDFNSINPADIESINILKDAAATAIYGVSGGNGVILVTTKSGINSKKTQFSISSMYGVQSIAKELGVLNASEYGAIVNEGSTTSGGPIIFPNLSSLGVGTNWQSEIYGNAPIQSYTIAARGGSDKVTYFLSAGYLDQQGILGADFNKSDFQRANFTANLNFKISPKLKFLVNATDAMLNSKGVQEGNWNGIIGEALNFDPTVPVLNTVPNTIGKYGFSNLLLTEVHNPLTDLVNTYNTNPGNKLYGKFEFQYQPIKNLTLYTRFGYTDYNDNLKSFSPLIFYGINNTDNSLNADGSTVALKHNSVSSTKDTYFNYNWDNFANYNFNLKGNNHFQTTLGMSLSRDYQNHLGASKQDVPFNSWTFASLQAATGVNTATNLLANTGYYDESYTKEISYFARANYDYSEKYLASLSVRRDGSSEFAIDKKYGNFYAGSLGWIVSKEDFFKSNFINFLKIRGSYGTVGSSNGASLQSTQIVTGGTYNNIGNSNGYYFNGVFYTGASVGSQINPQQLGWETDAQFNAGFDMRFFNNKFSLTADYYQKNVSNLLFVGQQSLYIGTVPSPEANIGSTKTNGLDASLSYNDNLSKNLNIHSSLTFTTSHSLVTGTNAGNSAIITGGSYFNGQSQTATIFAKGYTPGAFYGYKTDGLFQTQKEIDASPLQSGAQPGDIKYKDINGDGVIDSKDETVIGNPFPKFVAGWNLGLDYRGLDFTVFFYGSFGNDIFRAYERNATYTNKFRDVLARWTGPNTTINANDPRYIISDPNDNARVSDRYVENGSFIKIKNLQLGYTLPKSMSEGVFTSVRFYVAAINLLTLTKYSGYDPEISGGILSSGVDIGTYPPARTISFGIDLKF